MLLEFVLSGSNHTSADFLLNRAYEGKAVTANVLLWYNLAVGLEWIKSRKLCYAIILGIIFLAGVTISASGAVLLGVEDVLFLFGACVWFFLNRRKEAGYVER